MDSLTLAHRVRLSGTYGITVWRGLGAVDISLLGMFPRLLLQQPRRILMAEIKN